MSTVVGVFGNSDQALDALEALRGSQLHTDTIRLVGRAEEAAELASAEGAGAAVAAGPPASIVDSLLGSDLGPAELREARQRIEGGGALVLADELDQSTADTLAQHLREHHADHVIMR
jgi:hypothetical protein